MLAQNVRYQNLSAVVSVILAAHGTVLCNDRRLLVEPEVGMVSPLSAMITATGRFDVWLVGLRTVRDGNRCLALRIPASRLSDLHPAVGAKVHLRRLSYGPSRVTLTIRQNSRSSDASWGCILPSCWSVHKGRTRRIAMTSTKETPNGALIILSLRHMLPCSNHD